MFECSCYLVLKENGIATFGIESYAECRPFYCYAERHYAGCYYNGCHYAGCHYAGCHYAKLRGDLKMG